MYNVYTKWCDDNGEYKLTNTKFGMEMAKKYDKRRLTVGYSYCGIDFNEEYRPYSLSVKG